MTLDTSVPTALFTTLVLVVFFNSFGIYLLISLENEASIQSMIVISLSATDITLAISWIIEEQVIYHGVSTASMVFHVIWSLKAGVYLTWYTMIYLLTLDRFFGCNFPLRHRILIRRMIVRKIVIACWITGFLIGTLQCFHPSVRLRFVYKQYVWAILDFTFLVLFAVTYFSIFIRLIKSRRTVGHNNQATQSNKFLYTVFGLLVVFILFECIPTIIVVFWRQRTLLFEQIKTWLYSLNLLFDPLLYIFLQAEVRNLAGKKICSSCKFRRRRREYDIETIECDAFTICR